MLTGRYVFVVEDDHAVSKMIADGLRSVGAVVDSCETGDELLKTLHSSPPDLALVDLRLPKGDGLSLLAEIRRQSEIPVILITGQGDEFDEVMGLEGGADDFIRKPFAIRVLQSHIGAVLRRSDSSGNWDTERLADFLERFGWRVDDRRRELLPSAGEPVPLTASELRILILLAERPGDVVDRAKLYEQLFSREMGDNSRTVDVLVSRLRRKIEQHPDHGDQFQLQSAYGRGYQLTTADESDS